jgi:hypothetical protein
MDMARRYVASAAAGDVAANSRRPAAATAIAATMMRQIQFRFFKRATCSAKLYHHLL